MYQRVSTLRNAFVHILPVQADVFSLVKRLAPTMRMKKAHKHTHTHTQTPLEVERVDGALNVLEEVLVVGLHRVGEPRAARENYQQAFVRRVHSVQHLHELWHKKRDRQEERQTRERFIGITIPSASSGRKTKKGVPKK